MRYFLLACAVCLSLCCWSVPVQALGPFTDPLYGVNVTPGITYGSGPVNNGGGTMNLVLDLYQPKNIGFPVPANAPAILLIHGGGFVGGGRADMAPLAQVYANYGYTVVSIDYRMYFDLPPNSSPGPADNFTPPPAGYDTFPDLQLGDNAINAAVQDGRTALAWLQSHAATYNIDPQRIAVGGASAGAITSLLMAYNNPPVGLRPSAVLDFFGGMYGTDNVIQPGAPPAFIYHGNVDTQVPYPYSVALDQQLTSVGVYHEFYTGQGLGHALDQNIFNVMYGNESLFQHNIDFLANHLVVPEPSSVVLAGCGGLALLVIARRKRRPALLEGASG